MHTQTQVVIVGAGVIGLTCALVLSESSKNYDITIIASHFPDDPLSPNYTSPWAGAHFRPFPSVNPHDKRESEYTRKTFQYFKTFSINHPESSIKFIKGIEYLEKPNDYYESLSPGFSNDIPNFKTISSNSLPFNNIKLGVKYDTFVLNSPIYIQFLQRFLKFNYHVNFKRSTLNSLKQVFQIYGNDIIIINASGQGLQYNGGYDPKCFPIRGQTLLVRPPKGMTDYDNVTITHQDKNQLWTFVIPRPLNGGIILGGTKQPNDLDPNPRNEDTKSLIERGKKLYPKLFYPDGSLDIQNVNVGFRPAREGGSRIEKEVVNVEGKKKIVHAYGLGGMGFETSYGVAKHVQRLVEGHESKL